jgi:hypothetical protein
MLDVLLGSTAGIIFFGLMCDLWNRLMCDLL